MNRFDIVLTALLNETDFALTGEVPIKAGTSPVLPNHIRLYHYTRAEGISDRQKSQAAQFLRRDDLDINKAKGAAYGEPNVIWASTQMPGQFKVFAEFSIAMNDSRWAQGKPEKGVLPEEYETRKWDCYFYDSIRPEEIIAVHEPWHNKY